MGGTLSTPAASRLGQTCWQPRVHALSRAQSATQSPGRGGLLFAGSWLVGRGKSGTVERQVKTGEGRVCQGRRDQAATAAVAAATSEQVWISDPQQTERCIWILEPAIYAYPIPPDECGADAVG